MLKKILIGLFYSKLLLANTGLETCLIKNNELKMRADTQCIINLQSNPSTGYHWIVTSDQPKELLVSTYYEKNKKCIGCKQNLIVRVSKKVSGNFLLTMELFPPGKDMKAVERRLVHVTD